jgi:hypothetical protein
MRPIPPTSPTAPPHRRFAVALLLLAGSCEQEAPAPWQARASFHDFGLIPHGTVASVRLPIDFPRDRGPIVPLAFRGNCSCASWAFVAVDKNGAERRSLGRAAIEHAVLPDDQLFLELSLDTSRKEAVAQEPITSSGEVLVVDLHEKIGRVAIPVSFTYGIAVPVVLKPFAHVDFGALPMSRRFSIVLELHPRQGERVRFGPARVDDPRVSAELREEAGLTLLDVRVVPDRGLGYGPLRTTISVATDLPDGYTVPIPVTGQIVDDVEIRPMERISFGRLDLTRPASGEVILHDHDLSRPAAFQIRGIRGVVGKDLANHFSAELQPIAGDERGARLVLNYRGTFDGGRTFRGYVDVGKADLSGSVASIEFVGFGDD